MSVLSITNGSLLRMIFSLNSHFCFLTHFWKCHHLFTNFIHLWYQILGTEAQKTIPPVKLNQNPSSTNMWSLPIVSNNYPLC